MTWLLIVFKSLIGVVDKVGMFDFLWRRQWSSIQDCQEFQLMGRQL